MGSDVLKPALSGSGFCCDRDCLLTHHGLGLGCDQTLSPAAAATQLVQSVQIGGGLLPLIVLFWSLWQGQYQIAAVLISYFVVLGLQVLSETLSLRWFQSTAFVMVPYLYIPYRVWQLYRGSTLPAVAGDAPWVQTLLLAEIGLWGVNYGLDLAQLPRLFHWADRPERSLDKTV